MVHGACFALSGEKAAIWFAIITSLSRCMLDLVVVARLRRDASDAVGMREALEAVGARHGDEPVLRS